MPLVLFLLAALGAGAFFIARARPREVAAAVEFGELTLDAQAPEPHASGPFAFAPIFSEAARELGAAAAGAARKVFALPAAAAAYAETIRAAERQYGLPESLLARLLFQESRYREDIITGRTRSPVGALGIAQFMPATAAELGIDPLNPAQAIPAAAKYLRRLYDATGADDWAKALAAYNWGIGNVWRQGIERAPAETQAYMREILADVDVSA